MQTVSRAKRKEFGEKEEGGVAGTARGMIEKPFRFGGNMCFFVIHARPLGTQCDWSNQTGIIWTAQMFAACHVTDTLLLSQSNIHATLLLLLLLLDM